MPVAAGGGAGAGVWGARSVKVEEGAAGSGDAAASALAVGDGTTPSPPPEGAGPYTTGTEAAAAERKAEGTETLMPRPGSASMQGFDEDDLNTSRTYWEPSVTAVGLASPEMVKLKVEMLAVALCLPQRWERVNTAPSRGSTRGRPRQRQTSAAGDEAAVDSEAAAAAAAAAVAVGVAAATTNGRPSNAGGRHSTSPVALAPGQFFSPSRGIAPELAAALKEAVEQQAAYEEAAEEQAEAEAEAAAAAVAAGDDDDDADGGGGDYGNDDVDIGMEPGTAAAAAVPALPEPEPTPEPEPEPVPDQPFVRKAQGKWLSVESSSDEEDFEDDEVATGVAEEDANADAVVEAATGAEAAEVENPSSMELESGSVVPAPAAKPKVVTDASTAAGPIAAVSNGELEGTISAGAAVPDGGQGLEV
ncbi:unnamed protein product, partial [Laminaria digitata]